MACRKSIVVFKPAIEHKLGVAKALWLLGHLCNESPLLKCFLCAKNLAGLARWCTKHSVAGEAILSHARAGPKWSLLHPKANGAALLQCLTQWPAW